MTRWIGGRPLFRTRLLTTFKITLMVVGAKMEAKHPVFLPRLVPHVFNHRSTKRRSSARLAMPDHRSPSPMSTSDHAGTPMSTIPPNSHPPDPAKMIALMSALVNGDLEATASMFLSFYRVAPEEALSVLDILIAGDSQSKHTFSLLMKQLFIAEPRTATSICREGLFRAAGIQAEKVA
jgi:hypothetical protein